MSPEELKKLIIGLDWKKKTKNVEGHMCFYSLLYQNNTFQIGNFPKKLKLPEVSSLYKKEDPLNEENYRPVIVLPHVLKNFK